MAVSTRAWEQHYRCPQPGDAVKDEPIRPSRATNRLSAGKLDTERLRARRARAWRKRRERAG
eukprot:9037765-Alexandrium_andersonii.AAC.1